MTKAKVTKKQALSETHGEHCLEDTQFPCKSVKHCEWATSTGKVLTRCERCKRAYILKDAPPVSPFGI